MKTIFTAACLVVAHALTAQQAENRLAKKVARYKTTLESASDPHSRKSAAQPLSINGHNVASRMRASSYAQLKASDNAGAEKSLELIENQVFTNDFKLRFGSALEQTVDYRPGKHFLGIIKGNGNSVAGVSLINDRLVGLVGSSEGTYALHRDKNLSYSLVNQRSASGAARLSRTPEETCATGGDARIYSTQELSAVAAPQALEDIVVAVYVEVDYPLVQRFGSPEAAADYVAALFNQSFVLFQNEGITMQIGEMVVWDNGSPYDQGPLWEMHGQFSGRANFDENIGHLVSYGADGEAGGAVQNNIPGLCRPLPSQRTAFSYITDDFEAVPTYSQSVVVVTHEMGHLLGSRHTHACAWNGNGTPLDNCWSKEGACGSAPPTEGPGTIMSYCNLNDGPGVDLTLGFGEQPGNVIRNHVLGAHCIANDSPQNDYCPSFALTTEDPLDPGDFAYIEEVSFGEINNVSGDDGGYGDYTHLTANIRAGDTVFLQTVTTRDRPEIGSEGSTASVWSVWIDYNNDLDFDDTGELAMSSSFGSQTASRNVIIPRHAEVGATRMRVRYGLQYTKVLNSCGQFELGETEDYTINILPERDYEPGCNAPINFSVTHLSPTSVQIEFVEAATQATGYTVKYREYYDGIAGSDIQDFSATEPIILTGLLPNTHYDYKIRVNCGDGASSYSELRSFYTQPCDVPEIQSVETDGASATITWDNPGGDTLIFRYRKSGDELWIYQETSSNSITIAVPEAGAPYQVQLGKSCDATARLHVSQLREIVPDWQISVDFFIRNEWAEGATIDITIHNGSGEPVDGWQLAMEIANVSISGIWNATSSSNGLTHTFSNVHHNRVVAPNSSATFGFNVSKTGAITAPAEALLNGQTVPVNSSGGPGANAYVIVVRARGTAGGEQINLTVGGSTAAGWTLTNNFAEYAVTTELYGGINVEFVNDADGRDVQVDHIRINGAVQEAEDQSQNTGAWDQTCGGGAFTEWLHCNGYIGFSGLQNPNQRLVSQTDEKRMTVYPNPVSEVLRLTLPEKPEQPATAFFYHISGSLVKQAAISEADQEIDLKELRPGVFILQAEIHGEPVMIKFIKK